ncbi:MAG: 16S rRNA (guanine(527)-N(7))-methyltransferase RsmG [Gammaproteobacteria bacterium]
MEGRFASNRLSIVIESLKNGIALLQLPVDGQLIERLLAYVELLSKWNRTYNLTAIREKRRMVGAHLLDSLSVMPYINGPHVVDIGTGAGLPGVPLAMALPKNQFVLVDSNRKKTRFITQVLIELGIDNVVVENCRVEDYYPDHEFDTVVSRAYASIADMLVATGHLGQYFLAMKGKLPADELREMPGNYQLQAATKLTVPEVGGDRHIVQITKYNH